MSRGVKEWGEGVVVEIHEGGCRGRAESVPYARYGETLESVLQQIESARQAIANGASRGQLAALLPAGDRKSAVWGKSVSERVTRGGLRIVNDKISSSTGEGS